MDACQHCHARNATRPRGLCWACYYDPQILALYPVFVERCARCGRRLRADVRRTGDLCGNCVVKVNESGKLGHGKGCHLVPATDERIAELAARVEAGLPVTPDRRERDQPRRIEGSGPKYHGA